MRKILKFTILTLTILLGSSNMLHQDINDMQKIDLPYEW